MKGRKTCSEVERGRQISHPGVYSQTIATGQSQEPRKLIQSSMCVARRQSLEPSYIVSHGWTLSGIWNGKDIRIQDQLFQFGMPNAFLTIYLSYGEEKNMKCIIILKKMKKAG